MGLYLPLHRHTVATPLHPPSPSPFHPLRLDPVHRRRPREQEVLLTPGRAFTQLAAERGEVGEPVLVKLEAGAGNLIEESVVQHPGGVGGLRGGLDA